MEDVPNPRADAASTAAVAFSSPSAAAWAATHWISAGLGGYLAGRLRTRWIGTHSHEVFFRDTAHGLVTWAVATIVAAALVGASVLSMAGGGVHIASATASAIAQGMTTGASASTASYATDRLFRPVPSTDGAQSVQDLRVEAGHIMANAIAAGGVPDADRAYLAHFIAAKTGLSPADAQTRVDAWVSVAMEAETKAKAAANAARKTASQASIYTALSLLIGAFIASISAALGGQPRDEHP
jgi:hypothetical protein